MQRGIAFALAFIVVRASQADTVHYTTLEQITPQNVINLQVAWSYDTGDSFGAGPTSSELECNPIVVDGVMYVETPKLKVLALDAATGRRLWMFDPALGSPPVRSKQRSRGVTYWQSGRDRRIFITFRQFLFALDARTGRIKRDFGRRGKVDLREGLGRNVESISVNDPSPGVIFKDLLILGSSGAAPGDIRAFDVRTGRLRWAFHTIPHPGELGYDTWPKDAWGTLNGANAWAGLTIDSQRGLVFVPTASAGMGDRDFMALTDPATTCSRIRSSPCKRIRVGLSGTFKGCAMTSGIETFLHPRRLHPLRAQASESMSSRKSPRQGGYSCLSARPASRCSRFRSSQRRLPTSPANRRHLSNRFLWRRRRSLVRH